MYMYIYVYVYVYFPICTYYQIFKTMLSFIREMSSICKNKKNSKMNFYVPITHCQLLPTQVSSTLTHPSPLRLV